MYQDSKGYAVEYGPGHPEADSRGRVKIHRKVWHDTAGPIPGGYVVHHKDGDKANNSIENLECISDAEHRKRHAQDSWRFGKIPHNKGKQAVKWVSVVCVACGKMFDKKPCDFRKTLKRGWAHCCSKVCASVIRNRKRPQKKAVGVEVPA